MNDPSAGPPAFIRGGHWLITSASAKVDLAQRMGDALHAHNLRLFATDSSPLAAALHLCDDSFTSLPSDHPDAVTRLIEDCHSRGIRVILPTRDGELLFFAHHRDEFIAAGIWPLVSHADSIACCLDKLDSQSHFEKHGIPALPRIEPTTPSDYPCFVRARHGSASRSAVRIDNPDQLQARFGNGPWPNLLIQPLCEDPEYTIDALFDLDGSPVQWIARERIQVRAGESVISRTVSIPALDKLVTNVAGTLQLLGPITLQAFHSDTGGANLIEINPRIGGAAALGIEAGLATPERLVALTQGELENFWQPRPLQIGLTMLRYSQDLFLQPEQNAL